MQSPPVWVWTKTESSPSPHVVRDPGAAQGRPSDAEPEGVGGADHADPDAPLPEDAVAAEEAAHLLDAAGGALADAAHLGLERLGEIAGESARPVVVERHALAADVLEDVEDLLAPVERPHHAGDEDADVLAVHTGADPVGRHARQLVEDEPDELDARRRLDLHEALDGQRPRVIVRHRADVVEAIAQRHAADVCPLLGELLDGAMEVAEDRLDVDDRLPVERDEEMQHPMRRGVMGAEVDLDQLGRRAGQHAIGRLRLDAAADPTARAGERGGAQARQLHVGASYSAASGASVATASHAAMSSSARRASSESSIVPSGPRRPASRQGISLSTSR
jgi:hypothetical protein